MAKLVESLARLAQPFHRPAFYLLVRWGLGFVILISLLLSLDMARLGSVLSGVNWALALPAIGGLTAMHLVGAITWKFLSRRLAGIRFQWRNVVASYYAAQAVGSLTPSNIGADVYRVHAASANGHNWKATVIPIAVQRGSSYLGLLFLGTLALLLIPTPAGTAMVVVLLAGVVAISVLGFGIFKLSNFAPTSIIGRVTHVFHDTSLETAIKGHQWRTTLGGALLLALCFHAGSTFFGYVVFLATGEEGAVVQILGALVLARLTILLPFSVSGLGFQEGALVLLFQEIGMPAETALVVSLISRLAFLLTIAIGAGVILIDKSRLHQKDQIPVSTTL